MHPLHDYVANLLAEKLRSRKLVVWYDARGEFAPFIGEMRGGPRTTNEPVSVSVAGTTTRLAEYAGSMFELRAVVEPYVSGDTPESVVIYLPGCERDRRASVLMELEKAGTTWEPQLKQLAKNVLLQKYTLGVVDEMLPFDRKVTYEDLAHALSDSSSAEPPSILKSIFHEASGNDGLIAAWLVSDARDGDIAAKEATRELVKLVRSRLGLELPNDAVLAKHRAVTVRAHHELAEVADLARAIMPNDAAIFGNQFPRTAIIPWPRRDEQLKPLHQTPATRSGMRSFIATWYMAINRPTRTPWRPFLL